MAIERFTVDDRMAQEIDRLLKVFCASAQGKSNRVVEQAALWMYAWATQPVLAASAQTQQLRRALIVERLAVAACAAVEEVCAMDDTTVVQFASIQTTCRS